MGTLSVDKLVKTSSGAAEFTLPATDGTAGQVMQTDGAGQLSVAALAADTVTATQIAANAVTTTEIIDNAVTGAKIAMGSDATGDLLYYNGTDYVRLAAGTSDQVLTSAGAAAPTWAAAAGGGKVLQVLQPAAITSNTVSTTSSTFVDIAGVTIAITPSATSSKVLVLFNMMTGSNDGWHAHFRIVRDSTAIGIGDAYGSRKQSTSEGGGQQASMAESVTGMFLDSPSTTSATTYKLQWATESAGTIYLNRAWTNTDNANFGTFISTLTVMEIGA